MTRAIAPKTIPNLPESATGWGRSTKRADSMFHAHVIGFPVCKARLYLDRFTCEAPKGLGSFQYHGVCPRCYKFGGN